MIINIDNTEIQIFSDWVIVNNANLDIYEEMSREEFWDILTENGAMRFETESGEQIQIRLEILKTKIEILAALA